MASVPSVQARRSIKRWTVCVHASLDEFLHRLGYKKLRKGREHLQHLYMGHFDRRHLVQRLPAALELPQSAVRAVVEETGHQLQAAEEAAYSANFEPHAIILTDRLIPSPIFVAAFIGVTCAATKQTKETKSNEL